MQVTASDLVTAISHLPRNRQYNYIAHSTKSKIIIDSIDGPEGPIRIKRYNPTKGQSPSNAKSQTISREMLWRVANAIRPNVPINIDRVLAGSYNTRSALEALLVHTPQFFWCKPGRIEVINNSTSVKDGHKHVMFLPEEPHENGVIQKHESEMVISEIPSQEVIYDSLFIPSDTDAGMSIEAKRRHIQMQIALLTIGYLMGYKTWIALNDRGVRYQDRTLAEIDGVLPRLDQGTVIAPWGEAVQAARLIDVLWFSGDLEMPAVFEVEHSTGVNSGLSRMQNFQSKMPQFPTRYIIVAPDEDRAKVLKEISKEQFVSLDAKYMPYSAVEELWTLFSRRGSKGVESSFIENFTER